MELVGEPLSERTTRYTPGLTWAEAAEALRHDRSLQDELTRVCAEHAGIFWECVPSARAHQDVPFAFVTVQTEAVAALTVDRRAFPRELAAATGPVAVFRNLSGDALLLVPTGAVPEGCAHLASWCRSAPASEQRALWAEVGRQVQAWWARTADPVWVSTSGLGVSWLHVRLDERPKYYSHRPYRLPPGERPTAPAPPPRSPRRRR